MASHAARSLHFAVRLRVVLHYLGQICIPLAALNLVPAAVSAAGGRLRVAGLGLAVSAAAAAAAVLTRNLAGGERIQRNEAMVVVAAAFVLASVAASVPLLGYGLSPLDALFEGVSGVTTTGLSILPSVDDRPAALLFARAWHQWVGGLGVVVLALAVLVEPGVSARRLGFDESDSRDLAGGTRAHARRVLRVYVVMTALGIAGLWLAGAGVLDAVVHALAAVSTGGFSSHDASLGALGPAPRAITLVLCLAGSVSFAWYYLGALRQPHQMARDRQIRALLLLCAGVTAALWALARLGPEPRALGLGDAAVTAISAQSTAGFNTVPPAELGDASLLVLVVSMAVGGEVGSTAGGIKILRLLVVLAALRRLLQRASLPPSAWLPLRVGRQRIEQSEMSACLALGAAFSATLLLAWGAFLGYGHDPLPALFDVTSALATVGLSAGVVGPELEPPLKALTCVVMLLGRVEIFALLLLLYPPTWIGRRRRMA